MRFWDRRPKPARLLCFLVRRILQFHDAEPLLANPPPLHKTPSPPKEARVGEGTLPAACSDSPCTAQQPVIEKRSDSGQFRPVSSEPPPVPQPSTLSLQPAWSRQPNEPAADYQLFVTWLQLPAPRRSRKAAVALGCSLHHLRNLSSRHNWKSRAAAFDNHRAHAASQALDQLLRDEATDWADRARLFRLQEWALHEHMLDAARDAVREFHKHPGRISLTEIIKLYDLASLLGRRAVGMPLDPVHAKPAPQSAYPDFEQALHRVYGSDPKAPSSEIQRRAQ